MERSRVYSGAPWEKRTGYCRAIRVGSQIFVSGTAPVADDGSTFAPGDAYRQTRRCLDIVERALAELGATLRDVVRTRMYVTDIGRFEDTPARTERSSARTLPRRPWSRSGHWYPRIC